MLLFLTILTIPFWVPFAIQATAYLAGFLLGSIGAIGRILK